MQSYSGFVALFFIFYIQFSEARIFGQILNRFSAGRNSDETEKFQLRSIFIRGGLDNLEVDTAASFEGTCTVYVSTSVGSKFLDKKKKLIVPRNYTVAQLKDLVHEKFPGSPPQKLQRLFYGLRFLEDEEILGNVTGTAIVAPSTIITLDMLSGTSVYNKTLSISQSLEAYAAISVQQAYLGEKLRQAFLQSIYGVENDSVHQSDTERMEMSIYRDMFEAVNNSLHEKYAEDIAQALEEEADPEADSVDTAAWRGGVTGSRRKEKAPLAAALAKQFDLNGRTLRQLAYYSILAGVFAQYGTNTIGGKLACVALVPMMWIAKLRQWRLVFKLGRNLLIQAAPKVDFVMPLLPAPLQVIALESTKWTIDEDEQDDADSVAADQTADPAFESDSDVEGSFSEEVETENEEDEDGEEEEEVNQVGDLKEGDKDDWDAVEEDGDDFDDVEDADEAVAEEHVSLKRGLDIVESAYKVGEDANADEVDEADEVVDVDDDDDDDVEDNTASPESTKEELDEATGEGDSEAAAGEEGEGRVEENEDEDGDDEEEEEEEEEGDEGDESGEEYGHMFD